MNRISEIYWETMYKMKDINIAYDYFDNAVVNILDELAPMCKIQPRRRVTNWISEETRKCMLLRDLTRETSRKHKVQDDWNLYRRLRNKCNTAVRKDRVSHFLELSNLHIQNRDMAGLYNSAKRRMSIRTGGNHFSDWG